MIWVDKKSSESFKIMSDSYEFAFCVEREWLNIFCFIWFNLLVGFYQTVENEGLGPGESITPPPLSSISDYVKFVGTGSEWN